MGKKLKRIGLCILHQKYLWTILIFISIIGFLDPNSLVHRYELHQQNETLRAEIAVYEGSYNNDSRELRDLEHNQEAIERVARVNLYMKTADEDVYVIE